MKVQDCLLVIGELTMAKRYLEDQVEQQEAEIKKLMEELEGRKNGDSVQAAD